MQKQEGEMTEHASTVACADPKALLAGGPKVGESLWTDDPIRFAATLADLDDELLIQAAFSFRDNGYVHLADVLDPDVVQKAVGSYEKWCSQADEAKLSIREDGRRPRVVNLHGGSSEIRDLFVRSDRALRVMDFLFGYKTSVYTSLTFQYGTEQPLHRDTPVFRSEPEEFYFGCWFALEDADESNGALMALRGSHRGGRVDPVLFRNQHLDLFQDLKPSGAPLWKPYQAAMVDVAKGEGFERVLIPARRGDCVIWHPQLIHGGSKILDPSKTRLSVVFHVVPEGVPVYQADTFFAEGSPPDRCSRFKYELYEGRLFVKSSPVIGSN
jgi:hypothetical protein